MSITSPVVADASPKATGRFDFAEIVALAMTVVIGAGAFVWSFAALSDLSKMAGITDSLAWIGPVFVDGAIVQSIVALVSLKRRERFGVDIPKATRWFFWGELLAAELISVAGNALHAAESTGRVLPATIAATVAGAAPLFGLAATHGLTGLLEVPRPETGPATAGDTEATAGDTSRDTGDTEATAGYIEATQAAADATAGRDTEIWQLHCAGLSYRRIAVIVDLHHGTVGKIVARLKAEHDATTIEPLALPEAPENVRRIAG
ncbi:DUF2637 domain-containing protein [Nocardia flavorosea]|uniref:DUF2637 domain-containing protein n=1 Tax=Nocardia flavorosea TaxID=53429 RepID=A0A846YTC1_9NOCA|nr:DUF2637 domain-containing protein [Nocardia flavorosea]NKY60911.1 DUF2637 domain-containing protein [Nocardia flavorosea]